MINIIKRKFAEQRKGVIYYAIGLLAYIWSLIALYPTITSKISFEEYIKAFPEDLMKFFGSSSGGMISSIENFLTFEYLGVFFVLILSFFVASSAGSSIAGAIEQKTIDFDLSQPISRTKYLLSQTSVTTIYIIILTAFNSVAIYLTSRLHGVKLNPSGLLALFILALAIMLSIYGLAIVLSTLLKSKALVMTSTVFLVLAMNIFQSLTSIVDKLEKFQKSTIFYMYDPQNTLVEGTLNIKHLAVYMLVYLLGIIISLNIFNRKDLS